MFDGVTIPWETYAAAAAVFATLIALLERGTTWTLRGLDSWRAWRRRRNIKGLILKPTTEELAKYSVPTFVPFSEEELEHRRALRAVRSAITKEMAERLRRMGVRMLVIAFYFLVGFVALAVLYTMAAL